MAYFNNVGQVLVLLVAEISVRYIMIISVGLMSQESKIVADTVLTQHLNLDFQINYLDQQKEKSLRTPITQALQKSGNVTLMIRTNAWINAPKMNGLHMKNLLLIMDFGMVSLVKV